LYRSSLFSARRRYVEQSCDEWWILSAEHGLVDPRTVLDPYDTSLTDSDSSTRRSWSQGVLRAIDTQISPAAGETFEIHAGANYRDFGLSEGLCARDCAVEVPASGMPIGTQLRFYKNAVVSPLTNRSAALDRLYGLLRDLEQRLGGSRRLEDCHGRMGWPQRGVYFFFEDGELRWDGVSPRIVRVGTHGLRPSRSTLWNRLSQHKGTVGGSMPGGGNHRGSIFRSHVGSALLASGDWPESVRDSWGAGGSASSAVRVNEYPLERAVSERIGAMPFLWLEVGDAPGAKSDRGIIETGAISVLSNFERPPVDLPSAGWLGLRATSPAIAKSGLWNVNHVKDSIVGQWMPTFERYLGVT
jgi:uncharacterized protein DUF6884